MKDFKKMAAQLGSRGGKASVTSRFAGKSKEEISDAMRRVRLLKNYTPEEIAIAEKMGQEAVKALNAGVRKGLG